MNNAAISTFDATIDKATPEQFDREFAINVRAPFFITQRALPLMRDGGRIINISSGVTWFATPQIVYSMTKGALNVLGRSLANTLGERGITVNTISPGVTDTDMNSWLHDSDDAPTGFTNITALDRIGKVDEIADAAVFFASDASRWVTGQNLDVNGGLYLGPRTNCCPASRRSASGSVSTVRRPLNSGRGDVAMSTCLRACSITGVSGSAPRGRQRVRRVRRPHARSSGRRSARHGSHQDRSRTATAAARKANRKRLQRHWRIRCGHAGGRPGSHSGPL